MSRPLTRHQGWHILLWKVCQTETDLTEWVETSRDFEPTNWFWSAISVSKYLKKILTQTITCPWHSVTCKHCVSHFAEANYLPGALRTNHPVSHETYPRQANPDTLRSLYAKSWVSVAGAPFFEENQEFCTRPKLLRLISLGGPWWKFGRLGCQRLPGPDSHQAINYAEEDVGSLLDQNLIPVSHFHVCKKLFADFNVLGVQLTSMYSSEDGWASWNLETKKYDCELCRQSSRFQP